MQISGISAFTCPEGQYLNIDTQKCQKCQAGTFSLSGGVRFRTWKDLPSGFSTWGENGDDDTGKITKRKCAGYDFNFPFVCTV